MAETMNYGWLQDYQGVKFAPKTLLPYIFNTDGVPIEQNLELQNLKVINQITGTIDNSINANKLSNIEIKEGTQVWTPVSKGSNNKPVYFENGIPKEIGYTIEKSVPSDAVFTDTTYSAVTQQKEGLMSAEDKIKLDGLSIPEIPEQIKYKAGNGISLDAAGTTFSHADTSNAQTFTSNNRTYVTGLTFDNYGHVTGYTTGTENIQNFTLSPATESEIGGVKPGTGLEVKDDGTLNVTISAGTNFELKPATSTSLGGVLADPNGAINVDTKGVVTLKNNYAGSESDGGSATSAEKLTCGTKGRAGNSNTSTSAQPVYFKDGVPEAISYTIGCDVPIDAKFTDTTYSAVSNENDGLMTVNDKKKLDTIETGTWVPELNYTDNTLSASSATYMKINDLIVVNFIINAGTSTNEAAGKPIGIKTSSLPYQPDFSVGSDLWYAGGGHIQHAYRPNTNTYFTGWTLDESYIYARANTYEDKTPDGDISEDWIAGPAYMNWPPYDSSKTKMIQAGGTIMYKTTGEKN